jgi:hypothetical protein
MSGTPSTSSDPIRGGEALQAPAQRPDWARLPTPPKVLRKPELAASHLERMLGWPRLPQREPESLVVRISSGAIEFKVGSVLPSGLFSFLIGVCFLPFIFTFVVWITRNMTGMALIEEGWFFVFLGNLLSLCGFALVIAVLYLSYRFDVQGAAGELLTVFLRADRQVHQRLPVQHSKGHWSWDDLHPYIETRNAVSSVNQALTLVEFDKDLKNALSFVTVQVGGMSKEPLFHTYSFLKEFMDHGVTNLPPFCLTALPEPGWYTSMPPWLLWLPRSLAKSIWAFFFLLFVWPVVVWSRLLRRVLPYSRWPAEFEAKLKACEAEGTLADKAWLAANLKPPEPLPLLARVAFAAAVVVSAPVWWWIVKGYAAGLAKFW